MTLRVVTPGLQTTVQDLGRLGHQRDAVPVGGAMDRQALRVANILVGNPDGAAALEVSLIGPALLFERPSRGQMPVAARSERPPAEARRTIA